jgi:hypothetical protein
MEEIITEEILLESLDSKIQTIKQKVIKLKSKAKKKYKQGKITKEELKKIYNICDRVELEMFHYEGRKFKGYTKSQVKMRLNKTLAEINKLLNDKFLIQALKHASCFAFFTAALSALFIAVLSAAGIAMSGISVGISVAAASIGGADFTSLTKKIITKFRELGVRFNNFESNIINNFSSAKNYMVGTKSGVNSDGVSNTLLKEECANISKKFAALERKFFSLTNRNQNIVLEALGADSFEQVRSYFDNSPKETLTNLEAAFKKIYFNY